jgi:hypothetical protein
MINITGLKDHQQSRLLTHYATIQAWLDTLDTESKDGISEQRMHEIEHNIENEKEGIRQVLNQSKNDGESPDEFIDRVLGIIEEIKKHIYVLPDDIERVVLAVLEQIEKILKFAKEIF